MTQWETKMNQKCSNCRFWYPQSDTFFNKETGKIEQEEPFHGMCRRYPKSMVIGYGGGGFGQDAYGPKSGQPSAKEQVEQNKRGSWAYPITRKAEWCGEWQEGTPIQ